MTRKYDRYPNLLWFIEQQLDYTILTSPVPMPLLTTTHLTIRCNKCDTIKEDCKILRLIHVNEHHGTRGCSNCREIEKKTQSSIRTQELLDNINQTYNVELVGSIPKNRAIRTTFKSHSCGHEFSSTIENILLHGTTLCKKCSKQVHSDKLRVAARQKLILDVQHDAATYAAYEHRVRLMTESNWKQYKPLINPHNLSRTSSALKSGHHLDHLISVRLGYQLRLSPDIVSSVENLTMIDWNANLSAREDISIKLKLVPHLIDNLTELVTKYSDILQLSEVGCVSATDQYQQSEYFQLFPYLEHKAPGRTKLKTHQQFVDNVQLVQPDLTVVGRYVNSYTKLAIHVWDGRPNGILHKGHGCPVCARTKKQN
jgi:hypothetical protein